MELDMNELELLANAAAPGPWRRQDFYSSGSKNGVDDSDGGVVCASYGYRRDADFDFIAAANPAVVLELVRRLREAEARVTAHIDEAVEAEREACAKACESEGVTDDERMAGQMFAREIRARNQPAKNGD